MIPQNREKFSPEENSKAWIGVLADFKKIADAGLAPDKCRAELNAISEKATSLPLTGHQRGAILARVNNYIDGNYGNTKNPENYASAK